MLQAILSIGALAVFVPLIIRENRIIAGIPEPDYWPGMTRAEWDAIEPPF